MTIGQETNGRVGRIEFDEPGRLSRRSFMGAAAGAGAMLGLAGAVRTPLSAAPIDRAGEPKPARPARNLIFLVSDGMSVGTMQLADLYLRLKRGRASWWADLIERGEVTRGVVDTRSANSYVTDSAAAACAWGTGVAHDNGRIGWAPDGSLPETILMRAKASGKATGLVTTTRLSHATPAGFCVNLEGGVRDEEDRIAFQMLERSVDVMLGGGARYFDPFIEEFGAKESFSVVRTRDELLGLDSVSSHGRWLGLFSHSHMAFELDREETEQPSLAEMTRAALARLDRNPDGFVVQIEGGRVDHAAHFNDAGGLLTDQVAFDEAIGAVLEFVGGRDDTLVVITTDHGNANPGLTDYAEAGIEGFEKLCAVRRSLEWAVRRMARDGSPEGISESIRAATGVELTPYEIDLLVRARRGERVDPFELRRREFGPIGQVLANHFKVSFVSPNHTADFVEISAMGPGMEMLPGFMRIHEVHPVLVSALDLAPTSRTVGGAGS